MAKAGKNVAPGSPARTMGSGRTQSGLSRARAGSGLTDSAGGRGSDSFGRGPQQLIDAGLPTPAPIEWCARCGTPASMCLGHYAPNPLKMTMAEKRDTQSTTGSGIDLSGLRSYRGKPGDE